MNTLRYLLFGTLLALGISHRGLVLASAAYGGDSVVVLRSVRSSGGLNLQANVGDSESLGYPSGSSEVAMIVSLCCVAPFLVLLYWQRHAIARLCLGIRKDEESTMQDVDVEGFSPSARPTATYLSTTSREPSPDGTLGRTNERRLEAGVGGRRRTDILVMDIQAPDSVARIKVKDLAVVIRNFGFSETGEVYVATWKRDGGAVQVLIKELSPAMEKQAIRAQKKFQEQLNTLAKLEHPNILQLLALAEGEKPCQVMEYPELGVLNVYLGKCSVVLHSESRNSAHEISRRDMLTLAMDACNAISYLSSKDIVHGDIAARHCFVTADKRLKMSCHELSQESLHWEYEGPYGDRLVAIRWCAPEILSQSQPATTHTDIWSLGVLIWEIFSKGKQPFGAMSIDEVVSNVIQGSIHQQPEYANASVFSVMTSCWRTSPSDRPTASSLVQQLETLSSIVEEDDEGVSASNALVTTASSPPENLTGNFDTIQSSV